MKGFRLSIILACVALLISLGQCIYNETHVETIPISLHQQVCDEWQDLVWELRAELFIITADIPLLNLICKDIRMLIDAGEIEDIAECNCESSLEVPYDSRKEYLFYYYLYINNQQYYDLVEEYENNEVSYDMEHLKKQFKFGY